MVATSRTFVEAACSDALDEVIEALVAAAGADLVTDESVDGIVVDDVIEESAAGAGLVTDGSVDDIVVDDVIEVAAAGADDDNEVVAVGADLFTDRSVDDNVVDVIGVVGLIAEAGPSPPGCWE